MNKFSIKDIETITGIKSHTIRIWEQRYDFLKTKRTDTNIRFYNDADLRLLLNVAALNENGYKISEIAKMDLDEMSKKVQDLSLKENSHSCAINSLTNYALSFNEKEFKKELASKFKKLGTEQTVLQIIYPFLQNIGILWQTGMINPAQEHFASSLIKQRLIVAIDSLKPLNIENSRKFLLFLPDGEFHEIALLFAYYLIKSHGHEVLYLGQSLSIDYLKDVLKAYNPDYIFSILTNSKTEEEVQDLLQLLGNNFGDRRILLAGNNVQSKIAKSHGNIDILAGVPEFLSFLNELNFELA